MLESVDTDVLVVGLGPAGTNAMFHAAKQGLRVLGIDRKDRAGSPVQCAEYIPAAIRAYTSGSDSIIQEVRAALSHIGNKTYAHNDHGLMIDRSRFDHYLLQRAQSAGAKVSLRRKLLRIHMQQGVAEVKRDQGQVKQIRYKLLIACDGARSKTASCLGLKPLPVLLTRQYTLALQKRSETTRIWLSADYPGGYAWLFPRGCQANLGMGAYKTEAKRLKFQHHRLWQRLRSDGILGESLIRSTGGMIPIGGIRSPLSLGSVMFAGDAAGLTHPISGAGIASALYSGEQAGLQAARFIAGDVAGARREYEDSIYDCYLHSMQLALEKRRGLDAIYLSGSAPKHDDYVNTWVGFKEYYESR